MFRKLLFFISICFCFLLNAQKNEFQKLESEIQSLKNNREKAFEKSKSYVELAKKNNNELEVFNGYMLVNNYSLPQHQFVYKDSLINAAIKLKDDNKIGEAYEAISATYQGLENYGDALEYALIALKYYKTDNDQLNINSAKYNIGNIKIFLKDYTSAKQWISEALIFFRNQLVHNDGKDYRFYYIYSLIGLIDTNTKLGKFNDNRSLIAEGKNFISKDKELADFLPYFISSEGTDFYFQNDYKNAILKLENALGSYKDKWKHLTEKYYLGMSHWNLGDHEKAMTYFKLIDEDYNATGKLFPEFRPTYEKIIEYHKERGDKEQQLVYTEKLLKIDRDLNKSISEVSSKMQKQFDTPNLIAEKEKEHRQNLLKYGLGLFAALLVSFGIYQHIKRKKPMPSVEVHDKLELLEEISIDYELYRPINKETVKHILAKLEVFEDEKQFTEKGIKLSVLANRFGTNERYLSQIIKTRTGKSFNEYLSDLRLNLFKTLSENQPNFASQNLSKIASQLGFTNHEMFIKEFKSKYNVTPRVYLDGLKF